MTEIKLFIFKHIVCSEKNYSNLKIRGLMFKIHIFLKSDSTRVRFIKLKV